MYVRSENVSEVLSLYIQMITLPTGLKNIFPRGTLHDWPFAVVNPPVTYTMDQ